VLPPATGGPLSGTGLGETEVTARATVAADFSSALELEPGGVLVVRSLDAGWAPIFPAVGAIVTDAGGVTDEGVLAACALGVPIVIGTRSATAELRTGDRTRVDPRAGTVSHA
jgi:pyruvate,water dikinase